MKQPHPRPDIQRLLNRRARQGLTYREISEESGIPIPTLSYWASKQRRDASFQDPETRFVPVEVEADDPLGAIAIELGLGGLVMVERGFDDEPPARVLSVPARC